MTGHSERLVVLVVLLPLLGGAAQLFFGRFLAREARWLGAGCMALAVAFAWVVLLGVRAGAEPVGGSFTLLNASPHALASGAEDMLQRYDRDHDGALTAAELGGADGLLPRVDLDGDGVVSDDELRASAATLDSAWIAVGELPLDEGRAGVALWLVPSVALDAPGSHLLLGLALLGLALTLHLSGGGVSGDDASATFPLAGVSLTCAGLLGSALASPSAPEFGLLAWQIGTLGAFAVQHAEHPERVGIGSLLLVGGSLALGWGGIALSWAALSSADPFPLLEWSGRLYAAGLVFPAAVLPLVGGSDRTWSASRVLQLMVGLAAVGLLLRQQHTVLPLPALAVVSVALMLAGSLRALVARRLDGALAWSGLVVFGVSLAAAVFEVELGPLPPLHLALALSLAFAAALLAADAAHGLGTWDLAELGGLRRRAPAFAFSLTLAAALTAALPGSAVAETLAVVVDRVFFSQAWALALSILGAVALLGAVLLRVALRLGLDQGSAGSEPPALRRPFAALGLVALVCVGLEPLFELGAWAPEQVAGASASTSEWRIPILVGLFLLAAGAAWALRRRDTSALPALGDVEERFASFAPQRRLVQPLLLLSTKWSARAARLESAPLGWAARLRSSEAPAPRRPRANFRHGALLDSALFVVMLLALFFLSSL